MRIETLFQKDWMSLKFLTSSSPENQEKKYTSIKVLYICQTNCKKPNIYFVCHTIDKQLYCSSNLVLHSEWGFNVHNRSVATQGHMAYLSPKLQEPTLRIAEFEWA